jgi:hypothetical protein
MQPRIRCGIRMMPPFCIALGCLGDGNEDLLVRPERHGAGKLQMRRIRNPSIGLRE